VQEALTNVVRHADAGSCRVTLEAGRVLRLVVEDDGVGLPPAPPRGVGLRSMEERAAELGGSVALGRATQGGLRIEALLPLPDAAAGNGLPEVA